MTDSTAEIQHILIVEDSLDQANLLRRWLESSSEFQVTTVQDGVRGSSMAQKRRWSLVITDINLPGSDGIEVIRASKAIHPETPVLAMTAYRDQSYSARALKEGADGFLHKPLNHPQLLERVKELLKTGGTVQASGGPTVMAIGAHPDNVESGCGGILLRHLDHGHRVVVFVLTQSEEDGTRSDRLGEAELAARLMGCRVVFADLPAGKIEGNEEAAAAIARVLEAFEPSVLYVPSEKDSHRDHRAAHTAALAAATSVPTVYGYQSRTSTVEFQPEVFVEISEYIKRKKEILTLFQTPELNRPWLTPAFVDASAIYWSRYAGFRRVEPLEVIRGAGSPRATAASTASHRPADVVQVAG